MKNREIFEIHTGQHKLVTHYLVKDGWEYNTKICSNGVKGIEHLLMPTELVYSTLAVLWDAPKVQGSNG